PCTSVSLKYRERPRSPVPGRSILITRAPRSARRRVAREPERNWLKSITRTPSSGFCAGLLLTISVVTCLSRDYCIYEMLFSLEKMCRLLEAYVVHAHLSRANVAQQIALCSPGSR